MNRPRGNSITKKLYNIIITTALITMVIVSFPVIIVFSAIIKDSAIVDKKNLMHEIMNQVDFNIASITAESRRIQFDSELGDLLTRYYQGERVQDDISIRLNSLISPLGDFYRNVLIITDQGDLFTSITRISSADLDALAVTDISPYGNYYLTRPFFYYDGLNNRQSGLSYISSFVSSSGIRGRLIINVDFSVFVSIFKSVEHEVDRYQWIGYDDQPIYPSGESETLLSPERLQELARTSNANYDETFAENGTNNILIYSKKSSLMLATQISQPKLLEQYNWFFFYYVLSIAILVVVILITALPMMRRQLRPLQSLSAKMKEFSSGNLLVESDIQTNDEIQELSSSFNTMTRQLRFYIQRTIENEKDKERMRYSLLISQVNPHFIYNTLNTITYLVRQNRSADIVVVNSALIKILRDSLRIDGVQIFDSVEQEIEVVKQYIIIQRYRYGSDFTVNWQIEDEVTHYSIPKNLIQPLVENALFHGLLPCEADDFHGVIEIRISQTDTRIVIQVTDNGAGMDEASLKRARNWVEKGAEIRGKHVGLKNIIGRINHLYGFAEGQSRLQIESRQQQGTTITILLDKDNTLRGDDHVFRFE